MARRSRSRRGRRRGSRSRSRSPRSRSRRRGKDKSARSHSEERKKEKRRDEKRRGRSKSGKGSRRRSSSRHARRGRSRSANGSRKRSGSRSARRSRSGKRGRKSRGRRKRSETRHGSRASDDSDSHHRRPKRKSRRGEKSDRRKRRRSSPNYEKSHSPAKSECPAANHSPCTNKSSSSDCAEAKEEPAAADPPQECAASPDSPAMAKESPATAKDSDASSPTGSEHRWQKLAESSSGSGSVAAADQQVAHQGSAPQAGSLLPSQGQQAGPTATPAAQPPAAAPLQRAVAPVIPEIAAVLSWESEDVLFKQQCELLKLEEAKHASEATAVGGDSQPAKGGSQWVQRGQGLLRVLRHQDTGRARAVVQQAGALHVLLNARLLTTKFQAEGKRVVRFLASERLVSAPDRHAWERPTYFRVKLPGTPQQEKLAAVLKDLESSALAATT